MKSLMRRELRLTAMEVISAITRVTVESPGDWETAPTRLPNIKLRATNDRKVSLTRTQPEFTTTVTLELLATVEGGTDEEAQDRIEALSSAIESAFFSAQPLVRLCQQFPTATTEIDITADGKRHIARALMRVDCETFEHFDATEINPDDYPPLAQLSIQVDTGQPCDPTGTYPDATYPESVTPAPRTSGPDGREEGRVVITF